MVVLNDVEIINEAEDKDENEEKNEVKKETAKTTQKIIKKKRRKKVSKTTIYDICLYFIIYSMLGFIIETIWAIISKGTWESRRSFLYGPFCGIYGLGAVVLILCLQYFKKGSIKLFVGGFIVGSIVEYSVSLFAEKFLNVKWWDYSHMPFNINGRICLQYSFYWGLLGIFLMLYIHPKIKRLIVIIKSKIPLKIFKTTIIVVTVFLFFDSLLTVYALDMFYIRKVHQYNLNVANFQYIEERYEKIYNNEKRANFIYKFFGDKKMIKTFPNLKTLDKDRNIIYFDCYVNNITPYYYKFNIK